MARRIRARTLGRLAARYIELFPEEAVHEATRIEKEERAGLMALLPPSAAWTLLRGLDSKEAAEWLKGCDDVLLKSLAGAAEAGALAEILQEAGEGLRSRVSSLVESPAAAEFGGGTTGEQG